MTWISTTPLQNDNRVVLSTAPEFPKPSLQFELGHHKDSIAHRISFENTTLALIRLDNWWDYLWVGFGEFPAIFGHLRAPDVDTALHNPTDFIRHEMLKKPEIFGRGDFVVEPLRLYSERKDARRAIFMESNAITDELWVEFETCGVIPLRKSSPPDSGRIKWYRKLAREGRLPPVFLYYHVGLISWLILDGHDRLHAAQLEGITPRFIGISSARRSAENVNLVESRRQLEDVLAQHLAKSPNPRTIDGINRRLISLYEDKDWRPYTRGAKLAGGLDAWLAECRQLNLPRNVFEESS